MGIIERIKAKKRKLRSNVCAGIGDQLVLPEYPFGIVLVNVVGASEGPHARIRQRSVCIAQKKLVLSVRVYVSDGHSGAFGHLPLDADCRLHGVWCSQVRGDLIASWRRLFHGGISRREPRNNRLLLGKPI